MWTNHIYSIDAWAIPANAPHKDVAMEFIKFVSTAEPQARFSEQMPYGPPNANTVGLLAADLVKNIPAGKNVEDAPRSSDPFWIDHMDELTERWNNWATQ